MGKFVITEEEKQTILEMYNVTNPKKIVNEQDTTNVWEKFPCVPKHPKARKSATSGGQEIYFIPNGKGSEDTFYSNGTRIFAAEGGKTGSYTCNDPIFQTRKMPKTEEDLTKPGYYLKIGDRGPLVQKLQRLLFNADEGYANSLSIHKNKKPNFTPFDGVFGPTTKSVVQEFQRDEQLKSADGVVGPQTWSKLQNIRLKYDWDVANQTIIDTEKQDLTKVEPKTVTQIPSSSTTA